MFTEAQWLFMVCCKLLHCYNQSCALLSTTFYNATSHAPFNWSLNLCGDAALLRDNNFVMQLKLQLSSSTK